jgi:hypothetical protein
VSEEKSVEKSNGTGLSIFIMLFILANLFWFIWFARPFLELFTRLVTALDKIAG